VLNRIVIANLHATSHIQNRCEKFLTKTVHLNKHILTLLLTFISLNIFSQSEKDSLLKTDFSKILEELQFMYNYDQATREYLQYQTFDKHITDSLENLNNDLKDNRINYLPIKSDSLNDKIWKNYINPMDKLHTERLIEIIDKYGFPSTKRLKEISNDSIDFNPLIILIHSPKEFAEDLKDLMIKEKEKK
jgi:predicted MPP superfamily phosphohydrolase